MTDIRASVVHAAAGGFTAAVAINADLLATDVERAATTSHVHDLPPVMDQAFWDGWYAQTDQVWSGDPNPWLVAEASELTPGRALDVGAGEGADALWLAEQGWEVTAVDIAALALDRGRAEATRRGGDVAGRIDWHPADVTTWAPPAGAFDLVTLQFVHLTAAERAVAYPACAAAVAAHGTLLVVGHDHSDLDTTAGRWDLPDRFFTAAELARDLGEEWKVVIAEARPRPATDPEGREITVHDTVLVARRLPPDDT